MSASDKGIVPEREDKGCVALSDALPFQLRTAAATCPVHGEYEASVMRLGDRDVTSYCPGCAADDARRQSEEADAARARQRAEVRQKRIAERLSTAGIPARFRACGFDNFVIHDGAGHEAQQRTALRMCQAFVQRWEAVKARGQVLVMTGSTGTGKTHLACAIANGLIGQHAAAVAFGTVSDHVRGVKAAFQRDSNMSERDAVRALIEPDLLILDEVGQRTTEYEQQLIFDVMNARYAEMRPMVLMSNLSVPELEEVLGDRLADRLNEVGVFINLAWPSYRARR